MTDEEKAELNGLKFELQDREHAYSILQEENEKLKQRITELVTAFNNYECAGPEQEQENTWEILRDKMHREIKRLEGKDIQKQSMSELDEL